MSHCVICNRATAVECGGCYDRETSILRSEVARLTAALAARDAAIEAAHARLCEAYRYWDADRDHKVGKIIGDVARSLKAALTTPAPADARACPHCGCNVFTWHEETSGVRYQRCRNCNERISAPADGEKGGG